MTREKEENFMLMKGPVHQEYIAVLNVYKPNSIFQIYENIKMYTKKLIQLERSSKSTIIIQDIIILLLVIERHIY